MVGKNLGGVQMSETANELLFRQLDAISSQIMGLEKRIDDRLTELAKDLSKLDDQYMKIREESGRVDERLKALEQARKDHQDEIDKAFSKNRDTAEKLHGVNLRMAYWAGAGAVLAVLAKFILEKAIK